MTTTQRTLTVNDILEALYRVPPHTPVTIKASIYIPDAGDGESASWSGTRGDAAAAILTKLFMPQASEELRAKFPEMDSEALEVLDEHFTVGQDFIIRPNKDYHNYTERENDAIDYLCYEWDYGFECNPAHN